MTALADMVQQPLLAASAMAAYADELATVAVMSLVDLQSVCRQYTCWHGSEAEHKVLP